MQALLPSTEMSGGGRLRRAMLSGTSICSARGRRVLFALPPPRVCWSLAPPPAPAAVLLLSMGMVVICSAGRAEGQAGCWCRWRRCRGVLLPPVFLQLCFGRKEWMCKLSHGMSSMLVEEPRASTSSRCVCGWGGVLLDFKTSPFPFLGCVGCKTASHCDMRLWMAISAAVKRAFALGVWLMCSIDCSQLHQPKMTIWILLFPRIEDFYYWDCCSSELVLNSSWLPE